MKNSERQLSPLEPNRWYYRFIYTLHRHHFIFLLNWSFIFMARALLSFALAEKNTEKSDGKLILITWQIERTKEEAQVAKASGNNFQIGFYSKLAKIPVTCEKKLHNYGTSFLTLPGKRLTSSERRRFRRTWNEMPSCRKWFNHIILVDTCRVQTDAWVFVCLFVFEMVSGSGSQSLIKKNISRLSFQLMSIEQHQSKYS